MCEVVLSSLSVRRSEENLALLRRRGALYLVATPRRMVSSFQQELIKEDWNEVKAHPQIQLKLVERDGELYVLSRSLNRAEKERAIRMRALHGLRKDLAKLSKSVRSGRVQRRELIYKRLGRLEERWPTAWPYLKEVELTDSNLVWVGTERSCVAPGSIRALTCFALT